MSRAPNHRRTPKSPNNVAITFFNTVHLLPNDLRFEHGGAKLVSCPGLHLTSVRPCHLHITVATSDVKHVLFYTNHLCTRLLESESSSTEYKAVYAEDLSAF